MSRLALLRVCAGLLYRQLRGQPFVTFLAAAGVALGVAMVVAIDIANSSALESFRFSSQSLRGAATHVITGRPGRVPLEVYGDLRRLGLTRSAPVITELVSVSELEGTVMRLIGIDPIAEGPHREFLNVTSPALGISSLTEFLSTPFTLVIDRQTAASFGLNAGDSLELVYGDRRQTFRILDIVQSDHLNSSQLPSNVLVTDIRDAQDFLQRYDELDRIDLFLEEADSVAIQKMVRDALPFNLVLEPANATFDELKRATEAFRVNLRALSLLAILVGGFLIYNTMSFNVRRNRRSLAILHSLGMTKTELFQLVFVEAVLIGLIGACAGFLGGRLLAVSLTQLVNQAYASNFAVHTLQNFAVSPWSAAKAVGIGLGCSLIGSGLPALMASRVETAQELQNRGSVSEEETCNGRNLAAGTAGLACGFLLLWPTLPLEFAFGGIFLGLMGVSFFIPVILRGLLSIGLRCTFRRELPFLRMALRKPLRRLGQTSVTVAAFMISLSVVIGIGSMVGSFRDSVRVWLDSVVSSDFYLVSSNPDTHQLLTPSHLAELRAFPVFASVDTVHNTRVRSMELGVLDMVVRSGVGSEPTIQYVQQASEDVSPCTESIRRHGLIISEPMAVSNGLELGDSLTLYTDLDRVAFPIVGVYKSYEVRSLLLMPDSVFRRYWPEPGNDAASFILREDADAAQARAALESFLLERGIQGQTRSNLELRRNALTLFDRTFAITTTTQVLAMIVAFLSVLASFNSVFLEQAAEFRTMRAIGVTRRQIGRLLLMESGLYGLWAWLISMPVGLVLSVVLSQVINLRSFGWVLDWSLQPEEILKAALVAAGASLLASVYPVWRINRGGALEAAST